MHRYSRSDLAACARYSTSLYNMCNFGRHRIEEIPLELTPFVFRSEMPDLQIYGTSTCIDLLSLESTYTYVARYR